MGLTGFAINGVAAGDYSGWWVSGAGDLNADGIADLGDRAALASPGGRKVSSRRQLCGVWQSCAGQSGRVRVIQP